jgi:hypothetical protein
MEKIEQKKFNLHFELLTTKETISFNLNQKKLKPLVIEFSFLNFYKKYLRNIFYIKYAWIFTYKF